MRIKGVNNEKRVHLSPGIAGGAAAQVYRVTGAGGKRRAIATPALASGHKPYRRSSS